MPKHEPNVLQKPMTPIQSLIASTTLATTEVLFPGHILLRAKINAMAGRRTFENFKMAQPDIMTQHTNRQIATHVTQEVKNLYSGIGMHIGVKIGILSWQISVNNIIQQILDNHGVHREFKHNILAASIAGASSGIIYAPLENLINHREVLRSSLNSQRQFTLINTAKTMVEQHGRARLFRAVPVTVLRELIFANTYLPVAAKIEATMKHYSQGDSKSAHTIQATAPIIAPIISAIGGALASQPFEITRARMQNSHTSQSAGQVLTGLFKEHGHKAFYHGSFYRLARIIPAVTFFYTGNKQFTFYFNSSGECADAAVHSKNSTKSEGCGPRGQVAG